MKIVTVIGARPQFVKAAVVSRVIAGMKDLEEVIIHTGQHFDANMSDVFFSELNIPHPHYNLNINGLSHGAMTGQMLEGIEKILIEEKPDWVLVYGDTNSTLAGALAAKKLHINVAHVEAGLRSFNMLMPEEINRILTDRISDVLFCPTKTAINNLIREGYKDSDSEFLMCGDVMQDAAIYYSDKALKVDFDLPNKFILATIHRAESTDNKEVLMSIFDAFEQICELGVGIVLPLHPRTKAKMSGYGFDFNKTSIIFIDPVGYLEMVYLLKNCQLVMTDSGGVQKEAYFFGKNCLTLRSETEWVELVEAGCNVIVGTDTRKIINGYNNSIDKSFKSSELLYGDGTAGEKIVTKLMYKYQN